MRQFLAPVFAMLVACGAPEAPRKSAPPAVATPPVAVMTACDLLTPDEIRAVTGIAVAAGQATSTGSPSQCGWSREAGLEGGVSLTLYHGSQAEGAWSSFQAMGGSPMSGVGTESIWNGNLRSVTVRKGDRTANLSFNFPGPQREWATGLAKIIGRKL